VILVIAWALGWWWLGALPAGCIAMFVLAIIEAIRFAHFLTALAIQKARL
jgi:hypothetical protein